MLNKDTFVGDVGMRLAHEVRGARARDFRMMLVHDVDESKDGCPFDRMFSVTPPDLLTDNIYHQLAIAWQPEWAYGHRRVSMALLKKALGASPSSRSVKKFLAEEARKEEAREKEDAFKEQSTLNV